MKLSHVMAVAATSIAVAAVMTMAGPEKEAGPGEAPEQPRVIFSEKCTVSPSVVCDAVETSANGRGPVRYRRVEVAADDCTWEETSDAGTRVVARELRPKVARSGLEILRASCVPASTVADLRILDGGVPFLQQACACRRAAGVCQVRNDAGTLVAAPMGRTLGPGYPPNEVWSGAGCQRKACEELQGESAWPSVCPRR